MLSSLHTLSWQPPGRLCDHIQRGNISLKQLRSFVLDEADKMVEMGFVEDIERVLAVMNPDRQILLFGATISDEVGYIKRTYMNKPMMAEAQLQVDKSLLEQYYIDINQNMKFSCLMHLLKNMDFDRMIIFCSTKRMVGLVQHNLREYKYKAGAIHVILAKVNGLHPLRNLTKVKSTFYVRPQLQRVVLTFEAYHTLSTSIYHVTRKSTCTV